MEPERLDLITTIDIQNFRKLKSCRVELSENKTVFVGANNSGKTSAMDALMIFLKKTRHKDLSTTDFTLSNWKNINKIATDWIGNQNPDDLNLKIEPWHTHIPSIDIWLDVRDEEVHYVSHLIPTLEWTGGKLGIRLVFEPKNVEDLYKAFKTAYEAAKSTSESRKNGNALKLWPQTMREFLDKELHKHFSIKAYILDPANCADTKPQSLPENSEPIEGDPFDVYLKLISSAPREDFLIPTQQKMGRGTTAGFLRS